LMAVEGEKKKEQQNTSGCECRVMTVPVRTVGKGCRGTGQSSCAEPAQEGMAKISLFADDELHGQGRNR